MTLTSRYTAALALLAAVSRERGLSGTELRLLVGLAEAGGTLTSREMTARTGADRQHVTDGFLALARDGLVELANDNGGPLRGARLRRATLTEAGQEIAAEVHARAERADIADFVARFKGALKRGAREAALKPRDVRALIAVAEAGGESSRSDLYADLSDAAPPISAVVESLYRLERQALVERVRVGEKARESGVRLTEPGAKIAREAIANAGGPVEGYGLGRVYRVVEEIRLYRHYDVAARSRAHAQELVEVGAADALSESSERGAIRVERVREVRR